MEIDPSHIKNTRDFRSSVLLLADGIATTTTRSLEEYLQALWSLIQHAHDQPVTYAMLGQLLHEAFLTEVPPFHEMMLQYEAPPDLDDDKAPPDLNDGKNEEPFTTLQQMICYQIADLHRMAQTGQLENPLRSYGIVSPTGHSWFNFEPASYLQCAVQSLQENEGVTDESWMNLAILPWLGQIYE